MVNFAHPLKSSKKLREHPKITLTKWDSGNVNDMEQRVVPASSKVLKNQMPKFMTRQKFWKGAKELYCHGFSHLILWHFWAEMQAGTLIRRLHSIKVLVNWFQKVNSLWLVTPTTLWYFKTFEFSRSKFTASKQAVSRSNESFAIYFLE